jgi:hypothetical protein
VLLAGAGPGPVANVLRVVVPLAVAGWMLVPALASSRREWLPLVAWWAAPGLAFLLLVYMADPTYLCFLAGAFVLAAVASSRPRVAAISLAACVAWNTAFFLLARPVPGERRPLALVVNYYAVKYTRFGVEQQWMQIISDALRDGIDYPSNRLRR